MGTSGFFWVIVLFVGPSYCALREVLARIASITTDMDVESGIADISDCLIPLCQFVGIAVPRGAAVQRWLLPNPMCVPGWKHRADSIIQRVLNRMRFPILPEAA